MHRAVRPAEQLDVGGDPGCETAQSGHLGDASTQSATDEVVGVGSGQLLAHDRIVEPSDPPGQTNEVGRHWPGALERGAVVGTPSPSLEDEHRLGHAPAFVDLAEALGVGDDDVVEEFLAELGHFVYLLDGPDREARSVAGHEEPGESLVLGDPPVGAGEAHARIGQVGERAPDLLAVDDPLLAVPSRPRPGPGEVGSRGGL